MWWCSARKELCHGNAGQGAGRYAAAALQEVALAASLKTSWAVVSVWSELAGVQAPPLPSKIAHAAVTMLMLLGKDGMA